MTRIPSQFTYKNKVWTLLGCTAILFISYIFLVGSTMYNTLHRQRAEQAVSTLTAELSQMEFAYLAKEASITADLASSMGFIEPDSIVIARSVGDERAAVAYSN